jgi:AcrR family transcriptional regulator
MRARSSPGLRETKKAANREAILAAGRKVFIETGYEACTIRDIVRESGLSPGTFYNYFDSKEAVMRALLGDLANEVRRRIKQARSAARSPRSFIEDAYFAYFNAVASDPDNLRMMARNQSILRSLIFEGGPVQAIVDELAADLQLAIKNKLFPAFDVQLATCAIVGAGFELLIQMAMNSAVGPRDAAAFLSRLFVGGLLATTASDLDETQAALAVRSRPRLAKNLQNSRDA